MTACDVAVSWVGTRARIVATVAGAVQFVDACDPSLATARRRLLAALVAKVPTVDVAAVEAELFRMATEGAPAPQSSTGSIVPDDPAPWPSAVNGAELVRDIEARLRRYCVLPEHAGIACALWSLHSFCFREFAHSPRLFFTSGTKRSGKSVAAMLVGSLCSRPLTADNISAAAVYRVVEAAAPTLVCDEVDSWLVPKAGATEASEALRGVCNSGFARDGCVIRCAGDNSDPKRYATFGPMILAGIGSLPDTLADRAITVRMMRRADGEQVERRPVGITAREENGDLVQRARRWVADSLPAIREAQPDMPDIASDRARDVWFPLLVLADVAGEDIAARARAAAVALTAAVADDGEDVRTRLLADARDAFGEAATMTTAALLTALHSIVDAPWSHWSAGRAMSGDALARVLRSFGVAPTRFRVGGVLVRGYTREALGTAWDRYLPAQGTPDASLSPSQASHPSRRPPQAVTPVTGVTGSGGGAPMSATLAEIAAIVCELADELADGAVQAQAGYGPEALRTHYRRFLRAFGEATTAEAVRWRRECHRHGYLVPLLLPEGMAA